jgi:outer membrane protein assembly factor BamB
MYRQGDLENVIALDALTGRTLWTFTYDAPTDGMTIPQGRGPHATPLLAGDRIFGVGVMAKVHCLNKKDGSLIWSHDLYKDFGAMFRNRGYSASPLAYRDLIILTAGGQPNQSLMAFRQSDGAVVWKSGDLNQSQASPILATVDGQEQVIALLAADVAGFDPATGAVLWTHPHPTSSRSGMTITTPVLDGNTLFVSSAYEGGTRALRLTRQGNQTEVAELWFQKGMRVAFSTMMPIGDYIYASSGELGPYFFSAINRHTGEIIWRDRTLGGAASFLLVEGKLLLIDEEGSLALATASPEGLQIHQRAKVFDSLSRTVPTLIGTTAYLRNEQTIMALEMGNERKK